MTDCNAVAHGKTTKSTPSHQRCKEHTTGERHPQPLPIKMKHHKLAGFNIGSKFSSHLPEFHQVNNISEEHHGLSRCQRANLISAPMNASVLRSLVQRIGVTVTEKRDIRYTCFCLRTWTEASKRRRNPLFGNFGD